MPKATFEDRQEYVRNGKTYHMTAVLVGQPGADDTWYEDVEHVGTWLLCDVCNPFQVFDGNANDVLAGLRIEYAAAKADEKAIKERVAAVTSKLKAKLENTQGGTRGLLKLDGYPDLTSVYAERWTLDSKAIKAEQPMLYAQYAKQGSSVTLAEAKGE